MKQSYGKWLYSGESIIALFLVSIALCFPFSTTLAAQSTSTLEKRIQKMEAEIQMLQKELRQNQKEIGRPTQRTEQPKEQVISIEKTSSPQTKGNMVFFRGGYTELNEPRTGEVLTDLGTNTNTNDNGWYVGGGFDFLLSEDVWGLWNGASVLAELGLEYKNFGTRSQPTALSVLAKPSPENGNTALTMLTINASPKIKFTQWGKFQPWIIPAGLDIHVISPPSDSVTVLDVGFQVGAGAEYTLWKSLKIGIDGRWHWTDDQTFTNNEFWTIGSYLGISF